jgi:putative ABC transport system permease protein
MNDFRFAGRSLAKSPGYSAAVVVTLALGIGAAAAIFSVVDQALFRPPPYPHPEQLVVVGYKSKRFDFLPAMLAVQLAAFREQAKSFASFASLENRWDNMVYRGQPMGVAIGAVPADYFGNLGVLPLFGRAFVEGEDKPGADNVVILSHALWRDRFDSDETVVGRRVTIGNVGCQIVGVLPADFRPPDMHYAQIYQPLALTIDPAQPISARTLWGLGRLRPGVTLAQAQAELAAIKIEVSAAAARTLADREPALRPLNYRTQGVTDDKSWTMLAAVSLLYAIACANATNLMLARVHGRRKELSVRLAIGCSRGGLVRLVLVENSLLMAVAATGGLLVARWIFPALLLLAPSSEISSLVTKLDWRAVAFCGTLSLFTGLVVSLPAVWRISRADVTAGLKDGGQALGESPSLRRIRGSLVVVEAALAVVLLIGAGLMVRTIQRIVQVDRGIDPTNKIGMALTLPAKVYASVEARQGLSLQLDERLRRVPGVQSVAFATVVPLSNMSSTMFLTKGDGTEVRVGPNGVAPSFMRTLGLPFVKGHGFEEARPGDSPVAVISESLARQFFGDENPIGRSLTIRQGAAPWEIVGVVRDVLDSVRRSPPPQLYFPIWQLPTGGGTGLTVLLRTNRSMDVALADGMRRAIYAIDPRIVALPPHEFAQTVADEVKRERYLLTLLQVLAGLALLLALLGLFAVMAYSVAQRMGEFGIRMALGAVPAQLFGLVLKRGLVLVGFGIATGCGAAWGLTRLMQSLLYETSPHDPMVYGIVAIALGLAAVAGCWVPARRAMRVDVAKLLRAE